MRWETVALLVFGFLCGMTVMYILNRRQRIQEFNKIAEITEDIFNEVFKNSPLKRTKFEGIKRNIEFLT